MCGIIIVLSTRADESLKNEVCKLRRTIRHRGPDYSGMVYRPENGLVMAHERLVIVDPSSGEQPFVAANGNILAVNGEIYNHLKLREKYPFPYQTKSDCEVILAVQDQVDRLDGMYGFGLWVEDGRRLIVSRDPFGIIPLYYGLRKRTVDGVEHNELWIASEMKVLQKAGTVYDIFPPGGLWTAFQSDNNQIEIQKQRTEQYQRIFTHQLPYPTPGYDLEYTRRLIRRGLKQSVHKMLMSDVPYGVLLSGGLDSSLVASIAFQYARQRVEDNDRSEAHWPRLHSFCIGLPGAPDIIQARKVAAFLGTVHHEWNFTIEEGINALRDVIWYTETYDVTTIRASTPMYLLSKRIKALGVKMVLSGEGSDELFGGYLYFHKAPSPEEFYAETIDKVQQLYLFDCLRANKSTAAAGVEARPPFLDTEFVETVLHLDPRFKMVTPEQPMEKWILRSAFDRNGKYLPDEILWRQKEQFSDGCGYSWIDSLKAYTLTQVSDQQMSEASIRFPVHTPKTKEAYYYRSIFEEYYPDGVKTVPYGDSIACSTPRAIEWDAAFKSNIDQSGRSVGVHSDSLCKPSSS
jgi:asparagine synthase (glutamine-hydrolysing)